MVLRKLLRMRSRRAATVLVPLYIYPSHGSDGASAWDPLYQLLCDTQLEFTLIINPASGPVATPDANYTKALSHLHRYPNVRRIGYVAVNWGMKPLGQVVQEVATYAAWAAQEPSLALQGVFFDEVPAQYDPDHTRYLQAISKAVRTVSGLADGFVVYNPGTVPDPRYFQDDVPNYLDIADVTVVFEQTFENWNALHAKNIIKTLPCARRKLACLVHSAPPTMSGRQLRKLVRQMHTVCGHVFLTDLSDDYYASFSPKLGDFVDAVEKA